MDRNRSLSVLPLHATVHWRKLELMHQRRPLGNEWSEGVTVRICAIDCDVEILLRKFEAQTLLHLLQGLQMVMWCQSLSENRKVVYSMFMTCHTCLSQINSNHVVSVSSTHLIYHNFVRTEPFLRTSTSTPPEMTRLRGLGMALLQPVPNDGHGKTQPLQSHPKVAEDSHGGPTNDVPKT